MANRAVSIVICGKVPDLGWRRGTLVVGKNGKLKTGWMRFGGQEVAVDNPHFEIRYYQGCKVQHKNVGDQYDAAQAALRKISAGLNDTLTQEGIRVPDVIRNLVGGSEPNDSPTIVEYKKTYLQEYARGGSDKIALYTVVADEFINLLPPGKTVPSQITKSDVMAYDDAMAARGLAKSTRSGRYTTLRCLLRHMNIDPNKLVGKAANQELKSKPKTEPEVYTNEEIEKLFAVATPYHALAWECFLKFGFRDEELAFLTWQDINFDAKTVSVTYKPGFKPKDHEERTVPCPETLLDKLKAWHDAHPSTRYVLGTSSDKPNIKFLKALKSDWRRAGMNCGRCEGCTRLVTYVTPAGKTHTRAQQECEHAYLHKFRSSYLTRMLSHTNSRNVQRLAGHSSLTTTERYLRAAATEQMQSAVNAAFA